MGGSHFLQFGWPFVSSVTESTSGFQTTQDATVADDIVSLIFWVFGTNPTKVMLIESSTRSFVELTCRLLSRSGQSGLR